MAYGTADGVYVASIPAGCAPGAPGTLLAAGARFPDWGPADVPPASAFEHGDPATPGPDAGRSRRKLTLSVTRAGKVSFTAPGPGRAAVTFKLRGRSDRLGEQDGQGRGQGDAEGQAQEALARQGDRQGHLQARGGGATQSASASVKLR